MRIVSTKRFPLSEGKREELARKGVFAKSFEFGTFALCLAILISVFFFNNFNYISLVEIKDYWNSLLSGSLDSAVDYNFFKTHFINFFWAWYASFLLILLLPALISLTFFELLQSKFKVATGGFFNSPLKGFSVEKNLNYFSSLRFLSLLLIWLGAVFIAGSYIHSTLDSFSYEEHLKSLFEILNQSLNKDFLESKDSVLNLDFLESVFLRELIWTNLKKLCFLLTLISFFVAAFYKFIAYLNFEKTYAMTREEVEREAKESEPSPEMRAAQRQRH